MRCPQCQIEAWRHAGDLGFFDQATQPTSKAAGYPSTAPDALPVLDRLAQERAEDTPDDGGLIVADADLNFTVLSWMISRPDGIQADRSAHQRIGMRDV